jgi:hypothetical protein
MEQTIRNLIAEGKTKEAIAQLQTLTASNKVLHNDVVQLSARFSKYEKQHLGNLEDPALLGRELNQINQALLATLDASTSDGVTSSHPVTTTVPAKKRWWAVGAYIVAAIGVLASIAQISGWSMKDFITPKDSQTAATAPKSENALIKGIVKTEAGDILPDVKIIVDNKSMITDSNGYFEMTVKAHDDQTNYRINISKTGFETKNETYIPDSQIPEFRLKKQ